jgi:hypothetical protein
MRFTRQTCEIRRDAIKKGGLAQNIHVVLFSSCNDTPVSVRLSYKTLVKEHPELLFHQSLVSLLRVAVLFLIKI